MTNKTGLVLFCLMVFVLVELIFGPIQKFRQNATSTTEATPIISHQNHQLRDTIKQLQNDLTTQSQQLISLSSKLDSLLNQALVEVAQDAEQNSVEDDRDSAKIDSEQGAVLFQQREYEQYLSERVDPEWAQNTHNELEQSFDLNAELSNAQLTYADCRSNSCELKWTVNDDLNHLEKFELENNIYIELAGLGMDSGIGLNHISSSQGSNQGEYRILFKKSSNSADDKSSK